MKLVTEEIVTSLIELFNLSVFADHFTAVFEDAFITPALKKPGLDATNVQSYHTAQSPIYQWCRSSLDGSWHDNSTII